MRRQLDSDGEQVLTEWLDHYKPLDETRRLIAEAIRAFSKDVHQIRFYVQDDISSPGAIIIEPRPGLTLHVRTRGKDQFTLMRIIDEGEPEAE